MDGSKTIRELYDSGLSQELRALESKRKELLVRYAVSTFFILAGILSFIVSDGRGIPVGFGMLSIALFIISMVLAGKKTNVYKKDFKSNVVKKVVELIDPGWNYEPAAAISTLEYDQSGLFPTKWDRFRGDDLIRGTIEKTDFRLSEIHTEYKTESVDGKQHSREQWSTIFKGMFAHAEFNKTISGRTFVLPDVAEKLFGKWGQKLQRNDSRGQLVKLENTAFEKHFVVYSDDQIEARYILTPAMMEAMVDIRNQLKKKMYFSFIGSRVYIAISFSKDLFEPRILKAGVNFADMEQMYLHLNIISLIVREMNLNTRIWTKE